MSRLNQVMTSIVTNDSVTCMYCVATSEESSGNRDDTGNHDNSDEYQLMTASVHMEGVGITVYRSTVSRL